MRVHFVLELRIYFKKKRFDTNSIIYFSDRKIRRRVHPVYSYALCEHYYDAVFFLNLFFFLTYDPLVRDAVRTLAPRTRWQYYYYNYCFDYYFYGCYYNDYNSRRRTRTHSKRHPTVFGAFGFAISE